MWKGLAVKTRLPARVAGRIARDLRSVEVNMVVVVMWERAAGQPGRFGRETGVR